MKFLSSSLSNSPFSNLFNNLRSNLNSRSRKDKGCHFLLVQPTSIKIRVQQLFLRMKRRIMEGFLEELRRTNSIIFCRENRQPNNLKQSSKNNWSLRTIWILQSLHPINLLNNPNSNKRNQRRRWLLSSRKPKMRATFETRQIRLLPCTECKSSKNNKRSKPSNHLKQTHWVTLQLKLNPKPMLHQKLRLKKTEVYSTIQMMRMIPSTNH